MLSTVGQASMLSTVGQASMLSTVVADEIGNNHFGLCLQFLGVM